MQQVQYMIKYYLIWILAYCQSWFRKICLWAIYFPCTIHLWSLKRINLLCILFMAIIYIFYLYTGRGSKMSSYTDELKAHLPCILLSLNRVYPDQPPTRICKRNFYIEPDFSSLILLMFLHFTRYFTWNYLLKSYSVLKREQKWMRLLICIYHIQLHIWFRFILT